MHRVIIGAAAVILVAGSVSCSRAGTGLGDRASALVAPSAVGETAPLGSSAGVAGKPRPGGGSSTLALQMVEDVNQNGSPNWGDSIRFEVSTTVTTEPHVNLKCYQNGAVVYGATTGYYATYPWPWTQVMKLSSNAWQGGTADCVATLYYVNGRKTPVLASYSFVAAE